MFLCVPCRQSQRTGLSALQLPMQYRTWLCADCWPPDPRFGALGQRKLLQQDDRSCLLPDEPVTDAAAYQQWRFELGIAEGSEIPTGAKQGRQPAALWHGAAAICQVRSWPA